MRDIRHDGPILDFLACFLEERERGSVRPLKEYLERFPGQDEEIAAVFLDFREASSPAEKRPSTATEPPAGAVTPVPERTPPFAAPDHALGPYEIQDEIGRGGQGVVYLAEDRRLSRKVALKILDRRHRSGDQAFLRFRREAEIASRLDHPGICTVYDIGNSDGTAWIAMRFVEGRTLAEVLRDRGPRPATAAEIRELTRLFAQAARALHVAHDAGIIHRDVKPANIMVRPDLTPVILDFGLARDLDRESATLTHSGTVFGTPAFMAPELVSGTSSAPDRRIDIYALGVSLFLGIAGRPPFEAPSYEALRGMIVDGRPPSLRELNSEASKDLAVVVAAAIDRDPWRRYARAKDFADDLERILGNQPIQARPAGASTHIARWIRRNRAVSALMVFLVAALLLVAVSWKSASLQLDRFTQASDLYRVDHLLAEESELHPAGEALVPRCDAWLVAAREFLLRGGGHRKALEAILRERAASEDRETGATGPFLERLLTDLSSRLELLESRVSQVEDRRVRSLTLAKRTMSDRIPDWERCRQAVKSSPRYGGLELAPQAGLVPLGVSPATGLYEFWHVESGKEPNDDAEREEWTLDADSGLVLVLLAGGSAKIGEDPIPAGFARQKEENPRHEVLLDPFFISKYEMTQGQWMRGDEGRNPATYRPGSDAGQNLSGRDQKTLVNPIESVTWRDAVRVLHAFDLELPTEAQWEYAARSGVHDAVFFNGGPETMKGFANVLGLESATLEQQAAALFNDQRTITAPVGTFRPNLFGLYDTCGNVWEFCADDVVRSYPSVDARSGDGLRIPPTPSELRIVRGGGFRHLLVFCRPAERSWAGVRIANHDLGVRPIRKIRERPAK